ncbi:1-acyl-sn-glycerol-3-phosphate acyltransferase [Pontibacter sp. KCTC 32443]|uniref:lysophospholipid acyltransferase family protein n=1 Tax=Pontibacter TaxID=323449 RepID=UPI00164D6BBC|nr:MULTISPECIES: lysophospholipid acyltransferase family protein [Pontibacter]MBC5776004.1 1-acyl-sn-glycerol-3-phosphate acyltransferase [Pontibacter sp. KCTC 32443]
MLYTFLKLLYKTGLWFFFRKLEVRNAHRMPDEGPLLVVSNHPNTFMDPIVVAAQLQQPVFFIAKSTVFGSKFQNWMLRQMHLIPIHRKEDNPNATISNDEAFAASYKALHQNKTILIFPEGNSFNQRRLRKLKTGTARIALGAASESNQNVQILPVGLNYSDPTRFRSDVFVNVGKPIAVSDYLPHYQQDGPAAVLTLTEEIRVRLEKLIIHTPTDEEDELARQVAAIYKDRLAPTAPATALPHEQDFILTKGIIRSISHFSQTEPERVATIKQELNSYTKQLQRLGLQDPVLSKERQDVLTQSIIGLLYLVIGFPLYLYGLIHNYIPYIIPSKVARAVTKEQEWFAPIMLTTGIFTFPIFYGLEVWAAAKWVSIDGVKLILYFLSLPLSGFFTLHYWNTLQSTQSHWLLLRLFYSRQHLVTKLRQQRQHIISLLEKAQQDYLQKVS